jgi:hypothetical protein
MSPQQADALRQQQMAELKQAAQAQQQQAIQSIQSRGFNSAQQMQSFQDKSRADALSAAAPQRMTRGQATQGTQTQPEGYAPGFTRSMTSRNNAPPPPMSGGEGRAAPGMGGGKQITPPQIAGGAAPGMGGGKQIQPPPRQFAKGGSIDGCAQRGKTRGRYI